MISSAVGAVNNSSGVGFLESICRVYLESSNKEAGRIAAASGFEVYRSSNSVLPRDMTGVVA